MSGARSLILSIAVRVSSAVRRASARESIASRSMLDSAHGSKGFATSIDRPMVRRMKLAQLPIPPVLLEEILAHGFTDATPVQQAMIAAVEKDPGDLVVSSQTGSGKTLAF